MMLLSIMSCSTDSQNEDDVNYLSSYSNNEDGNIDENNDDSYNDNQNQNTDNNSLNNENIERTFTVSVQRQGYYGKKRMMWQNDDSMARQ